MDFIRLTKLLSMTTSDSDNEAMTAMRAANSMLRKSNLSWEEVLKTRLAVKTPTREKEPSKNDRTKDMLDLCMEKIHGPSRDFIESLYTSFEHYGSLTPKQFAALQKFYLRLNQ